MGCFLPCSQSQTLGLQKETCFWVELKVWGTEVESRDDLEVRDYCLLNSAWCFAAMSY